MLVGILSAVKIGTSRHASTTEASQAPADTAEKLLAAAERLFAEHGYGNVSVRAIAAAAGVNWFVPFLAAAFRAPVPAAPLRRSVKRTRARRRP